MSKSKAVGFDYAGVLGGMIASFDGYTSRLCKLLNIDIDTYRKIYFSLNHFINTGKVSTWDEFAPILLEKLGRTEKLSKYLDFIHQTSAGMTVIDIKMIELVDKLRKSGYKVGMLSNNTQDIARRLRAQGLDTHFDTFVISAEVGIQKPDPAIFELFASNLGVNLPELIFVDDAPTSLKTAAECGFTPILFESYSQLVIQLNCLGIPTDGHIR